MRTQGELSVSCYALQFRSTPVVVKNKSAELPSSMWFKIGCVRYYIVYQGTGVVIQVDFDLNVTELFIRIVRDGPCVIPNSVPFVLVVIFKL